MSRLIDADALMEKISKIYTDNYRSTLGQSIHDFFNAVRKAIRKAPTVDAVPVMHWRWIPLTKRKTDEEERESNDNGKSN